MEYSVETFKITSMYNGLKAVVLVGLISELYPDLNFFIYYNLEGYLVITAKDQEVVRALSQESILGTKFCSW